MKLTFDGREVAYTFEYYNTYTYFRIEVNKNKRPSGVSNDYITLFKCERKWEWGEKIEPVKILYLFSTERLRIDEAIDGLLREMDWDVRSDYPNDEKRYQDIKTEGKKKLERFFRFIAEDDE